MAFKRRIGAKAFGAFALLLCAAVLPACATISGDDEAEQSAFDRGANHATYLARVVETEFVSLPECPPELICMSAVYDMTLEPVEMIAGNPGIARQTFRVVQHGPYRNTIVLLVMASRDNAGKWTLESRSIATVKACVGTASQEAVEALEQSDSRWDAQVEPDEDLTCFSRLLGADDLTAP